MGAGFEDLAGWPCVAAAAGGWLTSLEVGATIREWSVSGSVLPSSSLFWKEQPGSFRFVEGWLR